MAKNCYSLQGRRWLVKSYSARYMYLRVPRVRECESTKVRIPAPNPASRSSPAPISKKKLSRNVVVDGAFQLHCLFVFSTKFLSVEGIGCLSF